MALGRTALVIRILSSFLCGAAAGLLLRVFYRNKGFFNFTGFSAAGSRDTDPNPLLRFLKKLGRNIKATGPMFLLGVVLSALFQRYVPADLVASLFGDNEGYDYRPRHKNHQLGYQLEQFVVVARYGTLSKAAEELHTSQPVLSRTMQKLEEELMASGAS